MQPDEYDWIPFYEELADALLNYKGHSEDLFQIMAQLSQEQPLMQYLHFDSEHEHWWTERSHRIDPFSVMAVLNRGVTDANRTALAGVFATVFSITSPVPMHFTGIPILNNMNSTFRGVDEPWALFDTALAFADTGDRADEFTANLADTTAIKGNGLGSVTTALYWARPNTFMPLDGKSRSYIVRHYGISVPKDASDAAGYLPFLRELRNTLDTSESGESFPELSTSAWLDTETDETGQDTDMMEDAATPDATTTNPELPKNLLLYGPPGTGKTYSTIQYAIAIIEQVSVESVRAEPYAAVKERYQEYKNQGLIGFTTFHQSYGYEEFIEGIRPVLSDEDKAGASSQIEYEIHDGVFKKFCNDAAAPTDRNLGLGKSPTVWKVSLAGTGDNPTRTECLENNHIRIGWDEYGPDISDETEYGDGGRTVLNAFYDRMQIGDLVFSCYSSKTIDAIGVVTGEPEWHDEYSNYKRLRKVNWLVKGINEDIVDLNSGKVMTLSSVYRLSVSTADAVGLLRRLAPTLFVGGVSTKNHVFIIDEINRGNIASILGELITLIEPTKRIGAQEELRSTLPYSGQNFGVPANIYLIGTMNTADRSIAMMDTALRRRFSFIEMAPDPGVLSGIQVAGIAIDRMLTVLNSRIAVLFDREHTIGHSYFLPLKHNPTLEQLGEVFRIRILPLLQEYFFDDYDKIRLVLGDNQKSDAIPRFIIEETDTKALFGNSASDFPGFYTINQDAFTDATAYSFLR